MLQPRLNNIEPPPELIEAIKQAEYAQWGIHDIRAILIGAVAFAVLAAISLGEVAVNTWNYFDMQSDFDMVPWTLGFAASIWSSRCLIQYAANRKLQRKRMRSDHRFRELQKISKEISTFNQEVATRNHELDEIDGKRLVFDIYSSWRQEEADLRDKVSSLTKAFQEGGPLGWGGD